MHRWAGPFWQGIEQRGPGSFEDAAQRSPLWAGTDGVYSLKQNHGVYPRARNKDSKQEMKEGEGERWGDDENAQ